MPTAAAASTTSGYGTPGARLLALSGRSRYRGVHCGWKEGKGIEGDEREREYM